MILLYNYGKYSAAGVVRFSVSARVAGGVRPTAVMNAVGLHSVKPTGQPKKDTEKLKKAKKLIVRLKISVGWD